MQFPKGDNMKKTISLHAHFFKNILVMLLIIIFAFLPRLVVGAEEFNRPSFNSGNLTPRQHMKKLFQKEFTINVKATTSWMNETRDNNGCRWQWRPQYFCGGVAHELTDMEHQGWEEIFLRPYNKWVNPDSIPGMWGRRHIQETLDSGYLQWITTYNIGQSYPAHYQPNTQEAVLTNIKVKETMLAYYKQFKLLMQIVAEFPDYPFVIHVEPDELGHMMISAPGDTLDPEAIFIYAGGTGLEELQGLPDNIIGYVKAIKILRDLYAPNNALLCVSPSPWDWKYRLSAQNWYDMFKKCGILDWDLAVCETGSADLGWSGKNPPYDSTTGMAGGIDNVITWVKQLHELSSLPFVFWQIPLGNTYFKTCNNTPGHYTHNTAQLLLENYPTNQRLQRFADAGGVALIFSPGQGSSTNAYDKQEDGITNPDPIAGNEGNESIYPDDDGGYLRLRVSDYYKNPIKINSSINSPKNPYFNRSLKRNLNISGKDIKEISIYSAKGVIIAKMYPNNIKTIFINGIWNGKDISGKTVPSGVYYIHIIVNGQALFQKYIMIN